MTDTQGRSLYHYGVLGMRWGFRKKPDGGVERTGKAPRGTRSNDSRETQDLRRNPVHTLTNAELKKINERLQLERTYASLTTGDNSGTVSAGRRATNFVLGFAGNMGMNLVRQVAQQIALAEINRRLPAQYRPKKK